MEENMTAANVVEDAEMDIDESSLAVEEQNEEPAQQEPAPEEPQEERTETQRVAQRIRDASQKSVDTFIRGMGLKNPYDGDKPILTKADYDAYAEMKKLDEE